MGILRKAIKGVANTSIKVAKYGIDQLLHPDMPLFGEEREAFKEGLRQRKWDNAYERGYHSGEIIIHQTATRTTAPPPPLPEPISMEAETTIRWRHKFNKKDNQEEW